MTPMNGPTRFFFDDPSVDRLLAMTMSLGAELAALREEFETLKAVAVGKGLTSAEELTAHVPSPAEQALRDSARQRLVDNLLFPLEQASEALTGGAS